MPDQRSVMKEFRFLEQKRQAGGLSPDEAARYAQLRDLVGPATPAPPRAGFDVGAAAGRLRESLLPAGLRNRPAEAPPPPTEPEPLPPAASSTADALEQLWNEAPFASLDAAPAPAADALFDPASLGQEPRPQAWNPDAPNYDPDAPYDEAAWIAAGYDPNATYDWGEAGNAAEGQPAAEAAATEGAASEWAEPAWAEQPAEPLAVPAPAAEEELVDSAALSEEPAQDAWEEPAAEAAAPPAGEALPFDPDVPFDHARWFGREPQGAAAPAAEGASEPMAWGEPAAAPAEPEPVEWGEPALPVPAPIEVEEVVEPTFAPAPANDLAAGLGEPSWTGRDAAPPLEGQAVELPAPDAAEPLLGEYDAAGAAPLATPEGDWLSEEPPPVAPPAAPTFGEYDEAATRAAFPPPEAEGLPFDPAAASAIEPGALPEGYALGPPPAEPDFDPGSPAPLGGYDDPSSFKQEEMYGGPEGDSLPGGTPLELGEPAGDWQPEAALDQGFELASDGSFGLLQTPPPGAAPAWAPEAAPAHAEGWEAAPALDLDAPFEASPAAEAAPELPTLDDAELVEELPEPAAEPVDLVEPAEAVEAAPGAAWIPAAEPAPEPEPAWAPPSGEAAEPAWAPPSSEAAEPAWAEAAAPAAPELPAAEPIEVMDAAEEIPPEIAAAFPEEPAAPAFAAPAPAPQPEPLVEAPPLAEVEPAPQAAPAPAAVPAAAAAPAPAAAPAVWVAGSHRVVVHTVDGQVKRGVLTDARLDVTDLSLAPQGAGMPEPVPVDQVKAIFFMLATGERAPAPEGKRVRVTFRDGRQVAGFSPDYREGALGFFMIPADTRTNTGRIWVYQAAVRQVSVS